MTAERTCRVCGVTAPLTSFPPNGRPSHKGIAHYRFLCYPCRAAAAIKRYHEHAALVSERTRVLRQQDIEQARERERANYRRDYDRDPKAWRRRNERWVALNPERRALSVKAQGVIQNEVKRGRMVRPSACEECGTGGRIEAAHFDYSRPKEVRWLCVRCHRQWDRAQPKTKGAVA